MPQRSRNQKGPPDPMTDFCPAWARLVVELRSVHLDTGDAAMLAVHTEALRQLLAEPRGPAPTYQEQVERYLGELSRTLSEALRPGTTTYEVRAAGAYADLLRIWLLDLLS